MLDKIKFMTSKLKVHYVRVVYLIAGDMIGDAKTRIKGRNCYLIVIQYVRREKFKTVEWMFVSTSIERYACKH